MTNNTTTENTTATVLEDSGLLDSLMDSPELMLMAVVIAALAAYIAYTQPAVKALVMPYIKKYDDEIMAHLEANLTKAQLAAFEKLEGVAQENVKNKVLREVILSAWDENDDAMADAVKAKVRAAMKK
tara:strand:- start:671 stop:1054 length:384 start_codon:yes stop_codon:yes gene_type:complete